MLKEGGQTSTETVDEMEMTAFVPLKVYIVELQWLEHRWLVYHGCFELVLESPGKNPLAADLG